MWSLVSDRLTLSLIINQKFISLKSSQNFFSIMPTRCCITLQFIIFPPKVCGSLPILYQDSAFTVYQLPTQGWSFSLGSPAWCYITLQYISNLLKGWGFYQGSSACCCVTLQFVRNLPKVAGSLQVFRLVATLLYSL